MSANMSRMARWESGRVEIKKGSKKASKKGSKKASIVESEVTTTANAINTTVNDLHAATCDSCSQRISGIRYRCSMCADYDNCRMCFLQDGNGSATYTSGIDHPKDHVFIAIKASQIESTSMYPTIRGRYQSHNNTGKSCAHCLNDNIIGYVYQCVQCQLDFCESCESKGVHDPMHIRLKIPAPNMFIAMVEHAPLMNDEGSVVTFGTDSDTSHIMYCGKCNVQHSHVKNGRCGPNNGQCLSCVRLQHTSTSK